MGIRFISLDTNGQKLVRWLIERNLSEGRARLRAPPRPTPSAG